MDQEFLKERALHRRLEIDQGIDRLKMAQIATVVR
jgi:hypothetical protein